MRIGFDARCLNTHHVRGMGKVLLGLLHEGLRNTDWTFVLFGDEPGAPMKCPDDERIIVKVWEVPGHRFHAWEQIGLPYQACRSRCTLLHCPGTWGPLWQPLPTIITVHDTLPWVDEASSVYLQRLMPAAYRRARRLVTASESSKNDIENKWPELTDALTVVRWGIDETYFVDDRLGLDPSLTERGIRTPYLLYFGGELPRKRLDWALRVWAALADTSDLQLVVCGLQSPQDIQIPTAIPPHFRARIIAPSFVDETQMPGLYASAEAVLYPTLYEGFGFPAVESQATGTPVLMSAVGSLAELAGPGAMVLPANDFDAWVTAARGAAAHKRASAQAARQWARQFAWSNTWRQLEDIYKAAARS